MEKLFLRCKFPSDENSAAPSLEEIGACICLHQRVKIKPRFCEVLTSESETPLRREILKAVADWNLSVPLMDEKGMDTAKRELIDAITKEEENQREREIALGEGINYFLEKSRIRQDRPSN